jgi:hypothetical protein
MIYFILTVLAILTYLMIGRGVYHFSRTLINDPYNDTPYPAAIFWPLAAVYYFALKYPYRLFDRLGERLANRQIEKETKRVEEQIRIRRELEKHLAEVEADLEKSRHTLDDQFEELDRQQSQKASA